MATSNIFKSPKVTKLIRFDWFIKYMLRDKSNFEILEGFLSELLQSLHCQVVFFWHSLHHPWYLNFVFSPFAFFSLFTGVKWVRTPALAHPLSTALMQAS